MLDIYPDDYYSRYPINLIDGFPNQPEIEMWPMTDAEWSDLELLDSLAAMHPELLVPQNEG